MIKNILTTILLSAMFFVGNAQVYYSSSLEWIFSEAYATNGPTSDSTDALSTRLRFSPIVSVQNIFNYDVSEHFGVFTGFNIRNIGYTTNNETFTSENGETKKWDKVVRRTYNAGIPLGVKVGNIEKEFFVYGGVELEYAFNYRERLYDGSTKKVRSTWFGKEVNPFAPSWFVGVNLPNGFALTYKAYFNNFLNQDYKRADGSKPYENYQVNVHYISLSFYLFSNFAKQYKGESTAKTKSTDI